MSQRSHNERDNCFYCERKFTFKNYGEGNAVLKTRDHVIPLSKGGVDSKINTVACCHHCNRLKDSLTMHKFIEKVKDLIQKGEKYQNLPIQSLHTVVKKAEELKQYVENKGVKLYAKNGTVAMGKKRMFSHEGFAI